MITGKINLAKLEHVIQPKKLKTGEMIDCIVIPIKRNHLYKSEAGNVYLDFICYDTDKTGSKINEPIINQSVSKEVRDQLKAAGQYAPTLGNMRMDSGVPGDTPNTSEDLTPTSEPGDDLPF